MVIVTTKASVFFRISYKYLRTRIHSFQVDYFRQLAQPDHKMDNANVLRQGASTIIVTGPSLRSSSFMSPPKTPVADGQPRKASSARNTS